MCEGKERARALEQFEVSLYAPMEGWDAVDRRLQQVIHNA